MRTVGTKESVDGMDRMDVMGKDLVNFVDLKATAAEKNHIGIKQMDVMEPLVEKGGINALLSMVLVSYNFSYLIYKYFKGSQGSSLEY